MSDRKTGKPETRRVIMAWLALAWEKAWPAWMPATSVVLAFLVLAFSGLMPALGGGLHALVLLALAIGLVVALVRYTPQVDWPTDEDVRRRLERDSHLQHRPLEVQDDTLPADIASDPVQAALFRRHQQRMAETATRFEVNAPAADMDKRDPLDMRFALIILLVVALAMGRGDYLNRLETALQPQVNFAGFGLQADLDIWANPPDYTGIAPIFLETASDLEGKAALPATSQPADADAAPAGPLVLPQGTVIEARVTGGRKPPVLSINNVRLPFLPTDNGAWTIEQKLQGGTRIAVTQGRRELGGWDIRVTPDQAPEVVLENVTPDDGGASVFEWLASDDYGIATAEAKITLKSEIERPERFADMSVELPVSGGNPTNVQGRTVRNLAAHPFAGLDVEIVVDVADQAEQHAQSTPRRFVLPEREFTHPVAKKIIEQRTSLLRKPYSQRATIAAMLYYIGDDPATFNDNVAIFLALKSAARRLDPQTAGDYTARIMPTAALLWKVALVLEDGDVGLAKERFEAARDALREALEQGDASEQELAELLREMQEALDDYMAQLAQEMMELAPDISEMEIPEGMEMETLDLSQLSEMLKDLQDMAETGAEQGALERLEQMEQMMEQMERGAEALRNGESMEQQAAEMGPWLELMEDLQAIIEYQESLQEQTFTEAQRRNQLDGNGLPRQFGEFDQEQIQQRRQAILDEANRDREPFARTTPPESSDLPMPNAEAPDNMGSLQPELEAMLRNMSEFERMSRMGEMDEPTAGEDGPSADELNPPLSAEGAGILQQGGRLMLGDLMRRMGEVTEKAPPEPLGEAEMAMRGSEDALNEGKFGESLPHQAYALEKLREGAAEYMQQLQQEAQGRGMGGMVMLLPGPGRRPGMGSGPGMGRPDGTDPLGRQPGGENGMVTDDDEVPDKPDLQRSREILDELRRRAGEMNRPTEELDYINRLLDRF